MAGHENVVNAAQAALDAVEEFWGAGSTDSFMLKARSTDVFRCMRNAWMIARSCRSVAQGGGGGFIGNPQALHEHLGTIRSFVEMASRADLEGDIATVDRAVEAIDNAINSIEHQIAGPALERHILGEWIGALREIDAMRDGVAYRQSVFDEQIRRWENVGKTSFGASETYTEEAKAARRRTIGWAVGAGVLAVFTVCYGISLDPTEQLGRSLGDALYMSAGRWVAFAVLIGAVTWCGRRASANAHLAAIARDRASAWNSYHNLLVSGGPAAEAASALAAKLFDTPSTGYLAKAAPSSVPSMPWKLDG